MFPVPGSFPMMRADFTMEAFRNAIKTKGYRVRFEKAALCPQRGDEDLDRHILNCTLCDPYTARIYYEPVTTTVLLTSIGIKEFYRTEGRFDLGTMQITLDPELRVSYWDRITLLDSTDTVNELIRHTANIDKLKGFATTLVRVFSAVDNVITDYDVENDVALTEKGNLQWLTAGPPLNTALSVIYERNPAYVVLDHAHKIRDTQVGNASQMPVAAQGDFVRGPQQALGKLDYLVKDETRSDDNG